MSPAKPARALGATCRADLLRLLVTAPRDALMLDVDASGWFGYVRRPEQPPQSIRAENAVPMLPAKVRPAQERKLPLRLPFMHAVVRREPRQLPEPPDTAAEEAFAHSAPIDEDAARAPSDKRLIAYEDLVPQARLLPALRRLLGASRTGPLDLERLTQLLAANQLPRRLPRRIYRRWHPDLIVLLDFCPRLWPYRWDMHQLAERLLRHVGRSGVSLRIVNHGPFGPWSDWLAHQVGHAAAEPHKRRWQMPPAETPVLIVSDLGMLLGPQSAQAEAWAAFVMGLIRAQVRPMALVPLGAGQLGKPVPPSLPVLRWSPDARPRPTRAHGTAVPQPAGLDDLLAMVAATRRVDPPLLRAMRQLNPRAPLNAGLEGALWCHADIEAVHTASIKAEAREAHLRHFADRLNSLYAELDHQRSRHHAHLRAVLNHEETLLWAAQVGDEGIARSRGAAERIEKARDFIRRLVATLTQPSAQPSLSWWSVAQGIVQRADERMWKRYELELRRLLAPQLRAQGTAANIPEHADPRMLAGLLGRDQPAVPCWLVQDAPSSCLLLQAKDPGARQSYLGEALALDAGGVRISVVGAGPARWLSADALPMRLASLSEPAVFHLETAHESVVVAAVRRPLGSLSWGCDRTGIVVRSAPFGKWDMRWSGLALRPVPPPQGEREAALWALETDAFSPPDLQGVLQLGIEPRFGIYADLKIVTSQGSATQRLRWIEPGTFLMGSPETEAGRDGDEGPQHEVTISKGFWLFDTPCTQALWEAVMGANPSRFRSPERPVEQVSWEDVQNFLKRINERIPGLDLALPTEAQWEYACRAGTGTPFSFGANITPEQVNYDGNYPYAGGKEGRSRGETVPVKSLPPNPWGLFEMHGNVWEWCADGKRDYGAEAEMDPHGPLQAGAFRALRGGSWDYSARGVRSAYRYALDPGDRIDNLGFRCARVQEGREPARGPEAEPRSGKPPEAAA